MPNFNQTGPNGQGPMTGRRMGRCANSTTNPENQVAESKENTNENKTNNSQGRGFGFNFGLGRGQGRRGRGFGMGQQNRFRGNF